MNAARLARNLIDDGVDPKLAQSLAENLDEEIERTVATKEHVDMVVTREVQQLRVEMHEEFRRADERITQRLDNFQAQITQRLDGQSRLLAGSMAAVFLAVFANILKDFLR
jgi:hypothetical protein